MKSENLSKIINLVEKHKYLISILLLLMVLVESGYLLWHANYFIPELEKRVGALESKVNLVEKGVDESSKKVEVDKLITQSKAPESDDDNGKVAGTETPSKQESQPKSIPGRININMASAAELDQLPGIGPAYANRIIEYRNKSKFDRIEDIKKIKGIGDATFNKIKDKISI